MVPQKIFNLQINPAGCALCDAVGLGRRSNSCAPPSSETLHASGYSHIGLGCLSEAEPIDTGLKTLKFVHSFNFNISKNTNYCLLTSSLEDVRFQAPSPDHIQWLLLVPQKSQSLLEGLRRIHTSWIEKLRIYWPHHSMVGEFGWQWRELLDFVRYIDLAFPHLRFKSLEGLDLFNPEIDPDLETEMTAVTKVDESSDKDSIRVSVIIPTYNNKNHLFRTVINLMTLERPDMEIIVVDDGSFDGTYRELSKLRQTFKNSQNLVLIHASRPRPRQMGAGAYRAGVSRNCGVRSSRGEILLFLDSDILIPSQFIDELIEKHHSYDLIQARRIQLNQSATASEINQYAQVNCQSDVEAGSLFWESFNSKTDCWDRLPDKWKYVSTFCLSIKRAHFHQLGGFRRSFSKYGFEDTDLGFRAAQLGLRFFLSPTRVFHFKHSTSRSEYFNSQRTKESLLKDSCRVFFLANQHIDILNSHGKYLTERI